MWRLLTWCNKHQISLRARHVPRGLSRRNQIQHTEWSLSPQIFKHITQLWEHPQIDLFVTSLNKKLPTYTSPIPDPQAWAVDALNISWKNMIGYAFPPTGYPTQSGPKVTVSVMQAHPDSPGLANETMVLGPGGTVSQSPKTTTEQQIPHSPKIPQPPRLVSIGVQSSRTRASLQMWQIELLHLKDSLLKPSTHQNGQFSNDGASKNRWTSGLPL